MLETRAREAHIFNKMASVLNIASLSDQVKTRLARDLRVQLDSKILNASVELESEKGKYLRVPFFFGKTVAGHIARAKPPPLKSAASFGGKLRDEQLVIFEKCRLQLEEDDVVLLVSFAGFGKTIVACALATTLKMKTLIVVNRLCLLQQWKNALSNFCSSDAVVIERESDFETDAQFSIVNVTKLAPTAGKILKRFHTVVLDETHSLFSEKNFQHLLRLAPLKLVGLTATDYRYDGLQKLFKLFYGPARVERKRTAAEEARMTAVRVKTEFKPVVRSKGMRGWGEVLTQSAVDADRNKIIVDIVRQHPTVVFIILVKRLDQIKLLEELLSDERVACLTGSQTEFDRDARIIIGTTQKLGTGFDFPKAGGLILAADVVQYTEQYIGRVMRCENSKPLIFDLYDNYKTLQKHFDSRDKVYGQAVKKEYSDV